MTGHRGRAARIARRALPLATLVLLAWAFSGGFGAIAVAAPPLETCQPGQTVSEGGIRVCTSATGGGGGIAIGGLLPIVLALVVGAGLALVAAYFVLRRRAGGPLDPVDAGEWWTCANCASQNVVGTSRCYSCGAWQGRARPEKPAAEP
jgi:hypothetical protein